MQKATTGSSLKFFCPIIIPIRHQNNNRRSLIKLRKRNRNRCQLLLVPLFTRPAAPRLAIYSFLIPVEASAPPLDKSAFAPPIVMSSEK